MRRRLERLQAGEENQSCFDCGQTGPTWASVNNGVFLCLACVRAHKELGAVVSDVRSVVLDEWTAADVAAVEAGGESCRTNGVRRRTSPRERSCLSIDVGVDAALSSKPPRNRSLRAREPRRMRKQSRFLCVPVKKRCPLRRAVR